MSDNPELLDVYHMSELAALDMLRYAKPESPCCSTSSGKCLSTQRSCGKFQYFSELERVDKHCDQRDREESSRQQLEDRRSRQVLKRRRHRPVKSQKKSIRTGTGQKKHWNAQLTVMVAFAALSFTPLLGILSGTSPLSRMQVKTQHLSYRELFTFPSATTEDFVLLTGCTTVLITSMMWILVILYFICRSWTTWGSSLAAFFSFTIGAVVVCYFALLNKVVHSFITIGGWHIKFPGALIVVLYSVYIMFLLALLFIAQRTIRKAFGKSKRHDLESGGEFHTSAVAAPANESGGVQCHTNTDPDLTDVSDGEQRHRDTVLAPTDESSRVQSHTSTVLAPTNESSRMQYHRSNTPFLRNKSVRVHTSMDLGTTNESSSEISKEHGLRPSPCTN